jgi:hypothetical protein
LKKKFKNRPFLVYQSSLRYFEISGKIPIRNTNIFGRERKGTVWTSKTSAVESKIMKK